MKLPVALDLTTDRAAAETAGWTVVLAGLTCVVIAAGIRTWREYPHIDLDNLDGER